MRPLLSPETLDAIALNRDVGLLEDIAHSAEVCARAIDRALRCGFHSNMAHDSVYTVSVEAWRIAKDMRCLATLAKGGQCDPDA